MNSWYASPFTGLVRQWGLLARRPHDPDVACWSGVMPGWGGGELAVGGAGWSGAEAEQAALGEAVERWQARALPGDQRIEASYRRWSGDQPAIDPAHWVLYHPQQYQREGFPFAPLDADRVVRWVCCRTAPSGEPCWVPEALVYLLGEKDESRPIAPGLSTGLSAGRVPELVLLRGLQEVIERDALVGAWWRSYPLEEHDGEPVLVSLGEYRTRLVRPNLCWRFYRIRTPLSAHVTLVTLAGEDHEGFCFSVGSACRATRQESWTKAILEAVQGRHYVRYLRRSRANVSLIDGLPGTFAGHALYYSLHPDRLRQTVLATARSVERDDEADQSEPFASLVERLGGKKVLFRLLTPPGLSDWVVLRVLVPGLQPLHGHHAFPFLGGPLWGDRPVEEYREVLPHPFP